MQALALRCLQLLSEREPLHADLARLAAHEAQAGTSLPARPSWQHVQSQFRSVCHHPHHCYPSVSL